MYSKTSSQETCKNDKKLGNTLCVGGTGVGIHPTAEFRRGSTVRPLSVSGSFDDGDVSDSSSYGNDGELMNGAEVTDGRQVGKST